MPSEALRVVTGLVIFLAGLVVWAAAVSRLVVNGYAPRRVRRVMLSLLVVSVTAGSFVGTLRRPDHAEEAILPAGVTMLAASALALAVAWLLPTRAAPAPSVAPAAPAGSAVPAGRRRGDRRWQLYLFAGLFLILAVVSASGREWGRTVLLLAGAALMAWLLEHTRRGELTARETAASIPPDGGPALLLRSFPRGPGGRDRVVAAHLPTTPGAAISLLPPRRLVDAPGPEDDWPAPVTELVRRAEVVLMPMDATAAAGRQLELVRREGRQERLFVIAARDSVVARLFVRLAGGRLATWSQFAATMRAAGLTPPAAAPDRLTLLGFDEHGRAVTVTTGRQSLTQLAAAALRHTAARRNGGLRQRD